MIKEIRKHFDVRIISLANYLGVSFETMQSISVHRRSYSFEGMNKLLTLYKALSLKTPLEELPGAGDFFMAEKTAAEKPLNKLLATKKRNLHTRKTSLHTLETKRKAWQRGLHTSIKLLEQKTLTKSDAKWVDLRKRHLEIRLAENTYFKEVELKAKIHGLKAEVAYITAFIAEQNNGNL